MNLSTFYQSKSWIKLVSGLKIERVNEDGNLICEHCGKPITKKYDCIGHHIIELTEDNVNDATVSLDPDNIKLIHFRCHNLIHQRFEGHRQNVYLVYGSPCSGKTAWVKDVANADDLVLDIDAIWQCVSINEAYRKPARLKAVVFGVRDAMLDMIRTRTGMWRNAYIIGGYPLKTDRDRLCEMLGAVPVFIEASKEECLQRAEAERPKEWQQFVEDWFDDYTE